MPENLEPADVTRTPGVYNTALLIVCHTKACHLFCMDNTLARLPSAPNPDPTIVDEVVFGVAESSSRMISS